MIQPTKTRTAVAVRTLAAAAILLLAHATSVAAQLPVLVRMDRFSPHETRVDLFTIDSPQDIEIEATGADEKFKRRGGLGMLSAMFGMFNYDELEGDAWRGNAWIIDAGTRKVVWELRGSKADKGSEGYRGFKGSVRLQPGTYEAYFASYSSHTSSVNIRSMENVSRAQILARTRYEDEGVSKKFALTIRGRGKSLESSDYARRLEQYRKTSLISLTGLRENETRKVGFELTRPTKLEVYALGEVQSSGGFDYGWIINADTRKQVWALDYDNSRPAGGAPKNRAAHQIITLPAGRYAAMFVMDDSHDATDWNAPPPFDPGLWGMTLRIADGQDRSRVRLFDYESAPPNAVVSLTGIQDDELRSAGFTITKPMDVRVLAMGEGTSNDMSDFGWITDARTRRRVWTMSYAETEHAGGSSKNRVASTTLHLAPGNYIANFKSDGSHSFEDWNSNPPIDGELWGITIAPVNAADVNAVQPYDEDAEAGVIAKLTGIEDHEDARATFRLSEPTNVRIYSIGEGTGNTMHDYGYIEERGSKRVVWEMTYRMTEHAGGAEKNRLYDGVIRLPAGEYVVRYKSDDSHSFRNFNSDAPDDPSHWGITIYRDR